MESASLVDSDDWQAWLALSTAVLSGLTAYNAYSPMESRVQVHCACGSVSKCTDGKVWIIAFFLEFCN